MGGTGWCTHPQRQTSSDVRILVRRAELACRNAWGEDLWESVDAPTVDKPAASAPEPASTDAPDSYPQISFEDEVTSVVDADIHRAQSRDDLNDRVVEQTHLDPDDQDDTVDEDRFDLLARGGRDSVSRARMRLRQRRRGELRAPEDDAPPTAASSGSDEDRFAPDDFVEEEGPAPSPQSPAADASSTDDIILSENVPQGTPRSRRLRRERERHMPPKPGADAVTSPDVPAPAKTPGATPEFTVGDPFNTVPEIAPDIDISRLRASARRDIDEPQPRLETPPPAAPAPEDTFEDAIRSARAIRAAARAGREGRHRTGRRAHVLPRAAQQAPMPDAEPSMAAPSPAPDPGPREAPSGQMPQRVRMSTRDLADDLAFDAPEPAPSPIELESPHRDDPRDSWWRGIFQPRQRLEQSEPPFAAEDDHRDGDEAPWQPLTDTWEKSYQPIEEPRFEAPSAVPNEDRRSGVAFLRPRQSAPLDPETDDGMEAYRDRLFNPPRANPGPRSAQRHREPAIAPDDLLDDPADAWYEPDAEPDFDVRRLIAESATLLDMTIEIAPEVPRQCSTCRSYRQSERGERGWCTNTWAFTHRQMVNAGDLACASTIGCWWLPADEEIWLDDSEPERPRTPRIDRLIAHLDPLKQAVGR